MRQDVNLLKNLPVEKWVLFTAHWISIIVLTWFLILLFISGIMVWNNFYKSSTLRKMHVKEEQLGRKLTQLSSRRRVAERAKEVREEARGTKELAASESNPRFSRYLETVALHTPTGAWLQHMVFNPKDRDFSFEGSVTEQRFVGDFVDALRQERLFMGEKFGALKVFKDPQHGYFSFTLRGYGNGDDSETVIRNRARSRTNMSDRKT